MQHPDFNKQFADQFRQEYLIYPFFGEEQYRHLLFRQFTGRDNEIVAMGNALIERISDAFIIKSLMAQLKQKNIPDASRLLWFVQKMHDRFYSYVWNEPHTASYFQELLDTLQPFYSSIDSIQKKMERLLNQLDRCFQPELNHDEKEIFYQDMADIVAEIALCEHEISSYYNYFYSRLVQETEHSKGVALTSHVAQYLSQLVSYTETIILSMEDLQLTWEKWHTQIFYLETQEMYN